jgi:acyl-coenzyme A synthetase/AMP-(fatty) acid ligase
MKIEAGAPFTQAAVRFADRVAIRDSQKRSRTYSDLRERANRVGSGLAALGIAPGDRVAVLSYNRVEVVELWLALERFNVVRVVLHSHFDMEVHVKTMTEVGARALIFDRRFAVAVNEHRGAMTTVKTFVAIGDDTPEWAVRYEDVAAKGSAADPQLDVDEAAPCFLQLTSGTTGQPKPWVHSHHSWRAVIANNLEHLDTLSPGGAAVGADDVNLHFHALQWATGFQTLMPYLLRGASTIIADDTVFDPNALADTILKDGVTGMLAPGPMLPPILDAMEARGVAGHNLKRVVIFFATPDLLERASRVLGKVWCHGFGSTEQGAPTTRLSWSDAEGSSKRMESVGRGASPFFELAVMNERGERLPAGAVGEIVVRSAMSTGSYWGLPDKTVESYFPGGWFRPNDIGYIDEEGFLFYLDRAKDRITTESGVVYPHMVETAVLRHADVANCGVVGIGGADRQAVVAAVLLKNSASRSATLASEIVGLAGNGLADHERPSRIVFVDELPTVLGGAKVQREVLKQRISELEASAK